MSTRTYRGFTIRESFMSASGTGILCMTRQGWVINEFEEVASARGAFGWASTLTRAKAMVDRAYDELDAGHMHLLIAQAAQLVEAKTTTRCPHCHVPNRVSRLVCNNCGRSR